MWVAMFELQGSKAQRAALGWGTTNAYSESRRVASAWLFRSAGTTLPLVCTPSTISIVTSHPFPYVLALAHTVVDAQLTPFPFRLHHASHLSTHLSSTLRSLPPFSLPSSWDNVLRHQTPLHHTSTYHLINRNCIVHDQPPSFQNLAQPWQRHPNQKGPPLPKALPRQSPQIAGAHCAAHLKSPRHPAPLAHPSWLTLLPLSLRPRRTCRSHQCGLLRSHRRSASPCLSRASTFLKGDRHRHQLSRPRSSSSAASASPSKTQSPSSTVLARQQPLCRRVQRQRHSFLRHHPRQVRLCSATLSNAQEW